MYLGRPPLASALAMTLLLSPRPTPYRPPACRFPAACNDGGEREAKGLLIFPGLAAAVVDQFARRCRRGE